MFTKEMKYNIFLSRKKNNHFLSVNQDNLEKKLIS